MKKTAWALIAFLVPSPAIGGALADAAKREQERRQKNKDEGVETTTVDIDGLLSSGTGKGTVSEPGAVQSSGTTSTSTSSSLSSSRPLMPSPFGASPAPAEGPSRTTERTTEVDGKRAAARSRLQSEYQTIGSYAGRLRQMVTSYEKRCAGGGGGDCQRDLMDIGKLAIAVALAMEKAEDAAREGWLEPGEVRDIRERYGLGDSVWDELVRLVSRYR